MTYDVIIIGSGPGGYVAAERAGSRGKSVLLVEQSQLGGVCLNEGCIPTKTLLHAAKLHAHCRNGARFGVTCENVHFDLPAAMRWKAEVIEKLRNGVGFLMKKNRVTVVQGKATVTSAKTVSVNGTTYEGHALILATGSSSAVPPIPGVQSPHVMTSREILNITHLPDSLVVIGGGAIGVEFASLLSTLGVKTTVIEMLPEILPFLDAGAAQVLRRAMPDVTFHLNARVDGIDGRTVRFTKDGATEPVDGEIILLATGRRPNVTGMGLETLGLDFDAKGIRVNEHMQTNVPGVYAIGDVTGRLQLAHAASRMADVAVDHLCAGHDRMRYEAVPWAVYGNPEAAGCGRTEAELQQAGIPYRAASMPMGANGRFLAEHGNERGICKVLVHRDSGVLLGVHLVGASCSEMIHSASIMIESEFTVQAITETIFPHPSVSEIIRDTIATLR